MEKACSKPLWTKTGFTLVELLITTSIMAILFSIGVAQYMKFNRQQVLVQTVLELKTNLTQARNMALAGKKTCAGAFDGVLVEANGDQGYRISSQCDDGGDVVLIEEHWFPEGVIRTGGLGSGVLFKTLTGGTYLKADETITLTGFGGNTKSLIITPSGKIQLVP